MEKLKEGVKFRVLVEKVEGTYTLPALKYLTKYPHHEVRYLPIHPDTTFTIYDGENMFFNLSASSTLEDRCLWSNSHNLLTVFHYYFESYWVKARKLYPTS